MNKVQIPFHHFTISAWTESDISADKFALLTPGFLNSKDYLNMTELGKDLAADGYFVASFDPVGTWESSGTINDFSVTSNLEQMQHILQFFQEQKGLPFTEIIFAGHSMGALESILGGIQNPAVNAVIAIMPPPEFPRFKGQEEKFAQWKSEGHKVSQRDVPGKPGETRAYDVPFSFIEDSYKYDLLKQVQDLHVPLLLLAGEKDEIIDPQFVRDVYNRANEPKKFILLEGMDHNYQRTPEFVKRVNQYILEFLHAKHS